MKPRNWISAALAAICSILPGCDSFALKDIRPGVTTAVEVRAKLGNPGYEFRNEDGSVTWEYTRQPAGVHCYMVTLGPDKIVRQLDQVLNEANYTKASAGMTREQIRRLLGRPARVETFTTCARKSGSGTSRACRTTRKPTSTSISTPQADWSKRPASASR